MRRMAEAKDAQEWGRLSCLLATIVNVNSKTKVRPWQLDPYRAPRQKPQTIKDLTQILKGKSNVREVKGYAP